MRERPILFNGDEVRAILDGKKTQTRRPVKPQPANGCRYEMNGAGTHALHLSHVPGHEIVPVKATAATHKLPCPFGVVGDRLWVRETWAPDPRAPEIFGVAVYRATDEVTLNAHGARVDRWRPSIHMPRWASRITLEVTDVRVQRVCDITVLDAIDEGFADIGPFDGLAKVRPSTAFLTTWSDIYGADFNAWCWAITFKRLQPGPPLRIPNF